MSDPNTFDSSSLVARLRVDDPDAWKDLTQRYRRLLSWVARQYGLSNDDVEDAVQLTWLRCVEHLDQLEQVDRIGGWLVVICRRECLRLSTKKVREIPSGTPEEVDPAAILAPTRTTGYPTSAADVVDDLAAGWRAGLLHRAVATLPRRERALIQIFLREDPPPYQQIGRELGMPVGAIGPVRQRALRRLRLALTEGLEPAAAGLLLG
jgi:RNA polymerase sigma factor (sigma-70 family)